MSEVNATIDCDVRTTYGTCAGDVHALLRPVSALIVSRICQPKCIERRPPGYVRLVPPHGFVYHMISRTLLLVQAGGIYYPATRTRNRIFTTRS